MYVASKINLLWMISSNSAARTSADLGSNGYLVGRAWNNSGFHLVAFVFIQFTARAWEISYCGEISAHFLSYKVVLNPWWGILPTKYWPSPIDHFIKGCPVYFNSSKCSIIYKVLNVFTIQEVPFEWRASGVNGMKSNERFYVALWHSANKLW